MREGEGGEGGGRERRERAEGEEGGRGGRERREGEEGGRGGRERRELCFCFFFFRLMRYYTKLRRESACAC